MRNAHIRNFSGPYFPTFEMITERHFVSLRILSECGKIRSRKTPNTDTFYALYISGSESRKLHKALNGVFNKFPV